MILSKKAQKICREIGERTKLGELRRIAKRITQDHELAKELWVTGKFYPRLLSILIMDNKELTPNVVQNLFDDIQKHEFDERVHLADWLMQTN